MKSWIRPSTPPADSIQALSNDIAIAVKPLLAAEVSSANRGIYLASGDAGIATSVEFWRAALADSPRFANPADFPWTLANAPAGFLARELGVRGPSYTLVGQADAMLAALEHAYDDLANQVVDEAVVVACELSASAPTQAVGVVLQDTDRELPEHTDDTLLAGSFLIELFDID